MPITGAASTVPIATIQDVPAHRAVPGRQQVTLSVTSPTTIYGNDTTIYTTNDEVWDAWNSVYTLTTRFSNSAATPANLYALQQGLNAIAAQATMTNDTWTAWNISYVASQIVTSSTAITTHTNTAVWDHWNDVYTVEATNRENQIRRDIQSGRRPSAEQQEKWRQEEIARKAAEEKRLREELTAKDKAIVLLKSCLTPQQLEEYERKKCFHLHVGDKTYRIEQGSHGNVKLVDKDGRVKRSFCVQPRGVPDGDTMLAQKLMLEADEKRFYELANVSEYGGNGEILRTLHAPRGADLLREAQQATG